MPTAARLVAAIFLAIVGWVASNTIRPLMPESTNFGYFNEVNLAIGFAVGWVVIGSRAGRGVSAAIGNGVTGAVALTFWGLFAQAGNEMLSRAMKLRYDGPTEAVVSIFEIGAEYFWIMATPQVLGTILIGGVVAAMAAEGAGRRWS